MYVYLQGGLVLSYYFVFTALWNNKYKDISTSRNEQHTINTVTNQREIRAMDDIILKKIGKLIVCWYS